MTLCSFLVVCCRLCWPRPHPLVLFPQVWGRGADWVRGGAVPRQPAQLSQVWSTDRIQILTTSKAVALQGRWACFFSQCLPDFPVGSSVHRRNNKRGLMTHSCNPSTREVEAGGSLKHKHFEAGLGLHSKLCLPKEDRNCRHDSVSRDARYQVQWSEFDI